MAHAILNFDFTETKVPSIRNSSQGAEHNALIQNVSRIIFLIVMQSTNDLNSDRFIIMILTKKKKIFICLNMSPDHSVDSRNQIHYLWSFCVISLSPLLFWVIAISTNVKCVMFSQ